MGRTEIRLEHSTIKYIVKLANVILISRIEEEGESENYRMGVVKFSFSVLGPPSS